MGTRHLTCVVKNNEYKVAQYGQWDGYPSGQGVNILNFLKEMSQDKFLKGIDNCFEPTEEQIKSWWAEAGHDIDKSNGLVSAEIYDRFMKNHPSLSRDMGSNILHFIQDSVTPVPLQLNVEFAADSLFCEYAYVIDLDKGTFEIFKGFNSKPLADGERFYNPETPVNAEYHPVRLIKEYRLSELPTEEAFLMELEPKNESDE
ncbi:hypothetical protein ZD68_06300 [Salmonella enterica subsp. enterica serovar Brandenburg]|nr:hypothetical protein [Salmonella enterica subsp. enterica serovar Brandenburg]